MKKIFIIILFLVSTLYALRSTPVFAADISFGADKHDFKVGEEFLVEVSLSSTDVSVNAVGGEVLFPAELLMLKEVRDGDSAINFWVERPHIAKDGVISFSGVTAGGFTGANRFLFGLVFRAKSLGAGNFAWSDIEVLANDGLGTKVETSQNPFNFLISSVGVGAPENLKVKDTEPPEDFTPFIASDPSIYDGKYFVVFSTVDKGSGMDHYEIHEGFLSEYKVAESPYLLVDQTLSKNIYIRAVDRAGNKRLAEIKARNPGAREWFPELLIFAIILLILCAKLWRRIWLKLRQQ